MFEELIERLMSILRDIENDASPEIVSELKDIINSLGNSECKNGMFCGMDKKW